MRQVHILFGEVAGVAGAADAADAAETAGSGVSRGTAGAGAGIGAGADIVVGADAGVTLSQMERFAKEASSPLAMQTRPGSLCRRSISSTKIGIPLMRS